jgi:hypothetical protein
MNRDVLSPKSPHFVPISFVEIQIYWTVRKAKKAFLSQKALHERRTQSKNDEILDVQRLGYRASVP